MNLKKILRFQEKDGWCGPAVIQMALFAGGVEKTQKEIAKDVCFDWWGTSQDIMYGYLSQFFNVLDFKSDASLLDIEEHLKGGHVIIANWWDDIDPKDKEGHYSLILDYDRKGGKITLADPSEGRGVWEIDAKEFVSKWYDFLDIRNRKRIDHWMLWIDPKSKI